MSGAFIRARRGFLMWIWPDDLWRADIRAEDILKLIELDLTFTLELKSGEIYKFNLASPHQISLSPVDFQMVVDEIKKTFLGIGGS
jgi:hypothetical protein